jgi:mono/diheme cytochrome c family protein
VRALWSAALLTAAACEGVLPAPDLERMREQPSYRPYDRSARFADQRAMRPPPDGTIPHDRVLGRPALTEGIERSAYVIAIPVPVNRGLLARGRVRFETFCAACHGVAGDGVSEVARNMALRKPPSLVAAPVTGFPPGRVFQVITRGYGLMPSYAAELTVRDRWAVVTYVEALQLSAHSPLSALPPEVRGEAQAALERQQ